MCTCLHVLLGILWRRYTRMQPLPWIVLLHQRAMTLHKKILDVQLPMRRLAQLSASSVVHESHVVWSGASSMSGARAPTRRLRTRTRARRGPRRNSSERRCALRCGPSGWLSVMMMMLMVLNRVARYPAVQLPQRHDSTVLAGPRHFIHSTQTKDGTLNEPSASELVCFGYRRECPNYWPTTEFVIWPQTHFSHG
jgi:hypothetical protein